MKALAYAHQLGTVWTRESEGNVSGIPAFYFYTYDFNQKNAIFVTLNHNMENVLLIPITIEKFKEIITETVKTELDNYFAKGEPPAEYITRKEAAKLLDISLPTLLDWTKQGIVPGYRIASRIRYKRSDIDKALKQIDSIKYNRN